MLYFQPSVYRVGAIIKEIVVLLFVSAFVLFFILFSWYCEIRAPSLGISWKHSCPSLFNKVPFTVVISARVPIGVYISLDPIVTCLESGILIDVTSELHICCPVYFCVFWVYSVFSAIVEYLDPLSSKQSFYLALVFLVFVVFANLFFLFWRKSIGYRYLRIFRDLLIFRVGFDLIRVRLSFLFLIR